MNWERSQLTDHPLKRGSASSQSASSPDKALNEKGRALSRPAPHLVWWPIYFLIFVFLARAADP